MESMARKHGDPRRSSQHVANDGLGAPGGGRGWGQGWKERGIMRGRVGKGQQFHIYLKRGKGGGGGARATEG